MEETCAFCRLMRGKGAVHKVYENSFAFAFLDKHPINPGHITVIPKKHVADFFDLDSETYGGRMAAVRLLGKHVHEMICPRKVGIIVAGWDVPYTHVHVVPMHNYHDITSRPLIEGKQANPTDEELASVATLLELPR